MRALIIEHEKDTPAGTTTQWLEKNKIDFEIVFAPETDFSKLKDFEHLIICGGSVNVDEETKYPWLVQEKEFIKASIHSKKNIIGLCLGGQLISEALGAPVFPMAEKKDLWEIGWQDVQLVQSRQKIKAFHWHQYQFDLPVGAKLLASSELCPHQAYTYKDHVLAFQFHPEVDLKWIELALTDYSPPLKGHVQTASEIRAGNHEHLENMKSWYFAQLEQSFRRTF